MINLLIKFLLAHQTSALLFAGFVGTGISGSWPDQRPKTLDDYWNWARDLVHILGNAKRPTKQQ